MSRQTAVVLIAPIPHKHKACIPAHKEKLAQLNIAALQQNTSKPHFLSSSFIATGSGNQRQAFVMLDLIVDGSRRAFLKNAVKDDFWREVFHTVFELCEHMPERGAAANKICAFLNKHARRAELFHIGAIRKEVHAVIEEQKVYRQARKELAALYTGSASRNQIWKNLREKLYAAHQHIIKSSLKSSLVEAINLFNSESREKIKARLAFLYHLLALGVALYTGWVLLDQKINPPQWQIGAVLALPLLYFFAGTWFTFRERPKGLKFRFELETFIANTIRNLGISIKLLLNLLFLLWLVNLDWAAVPDYVVILLAHLIFALLTITGMLLGYFYARYWGVLVLGAAHIALWYWACVNTDPGLVWTSVFALGMEFGTYTLVLVAVIACIRKSELKDTVNRLPELPSGEDHRPSEKVSCHNHMISVTKIRPGYFRLRLLVFLMRAVNFFAFYGRCGNRGGSEVIHFARFSILPAADGHYLVFVSNFDDGWSSYLGEFNPYVLNAVWGNTQGSPPTEFLLFRGAESELAFKRYARNSQFNTALYFSAYPDVLLRDRHRATSICKDLNYTANEQHPRMTLVSNSLRKKYLEHDELDLAFRRLM